MADRTEHLMGIGFASWGYIRPEFPLELSRFRAEDPQFFSDLKTLMTRAQEGTCRRKLSGAGVADDGDWDSPMATSGVDMGELRMPENHLGWMIRVFISACPHTSRRMMGLLIGDTAAEGVDAKTRVQDGLIREAESRLVRHDREHLGQWP